MQNKQKMLRAEFCFDVRCDDGFGDVIIKDIPKALAMYPYCESLSITAKVINNCRVRVNMIAREWDKNIAPESFNAIKTMMFAAYDTVLVSEKQYV